MSLTQQRRNHIAVLLVLAVLVAIAFGDVLSPNRSLYFVDHLHVFRPRWHAIVDAFRQGHLPLLTRASPGGVPLEGMMNGTYTPMTALFGLGSFDFAYDLFVSGHVLLLAVGVYAFAVSLKAAPVEAAVCAAFCALAGPVLSFENLLVGLQGLAWAPWVYLCIWLMLEAPSFRRAALLSLSLGFHFQAMMPTTALLDLIVGLVLLVHARRTLNVQRILGLLFAGCLGLAIASIHLMPVLEALGSTRRGAGFSYAEAGVWSLHPLQLIEFITPAFWSAPDVPVIGLREINDGQPDSYLNSLYLGSALFLMPAALTVQKHRRYVLSFLAIYVLALLMAFGHWLPLHRLVSALPILRSDRFPIKYLTVAVAAAGAMLPFALRAFREKPRVFVVGPLIYLGLLVALISVVGSPEFVGWLDVHLSRDLPVPMFVGVEGSAYPRLLIEALEPRLVHAVCFALLALLVALVASKLKPRGELPQLAIAAVIALDLALAGRFSILGAPIRPGLPDSIRAQIASPTDKLFRFAPGTRRARVLHREGDTYFEDFVVSQRVRGYTLERDVRYFDDPDPDGQSNPVSVALSSSFDGLSEDSALNLLARAGVGWVTTPLEHNVAGLLSWEVSGEAPHHAFAVPNARPYVSAYAAWAAVDRAQVIQPHVLAQVFTRRDTWDTAMVLVDSQQQVETSSNTADRCGFETQLREHPRVEQLVIDHRGSCRALVVARETVMPNWRAYVDGHEAELVEAELGFIGAFVPPGEHTVEFRYEGRTEAWWPLSLASLAIALLLLIFGRRPFAESRRRG